MNRRNFGLAAASIAIASGAPARDVLVKVLVGSPPGGTTDVMGRLCARYIGEYGGKTTVVENRAGAAGVIAATVVAKAQPDGQTLLMAGASHATVQFLYGSLPYDPNKDFAAVALIASTPYVLVVHPSFGVGTLDELVRKVRAAPGAYSFASSGNGNAQHLAGELLKRAAGLELTHVPYKGSSEALPDVLAGRVPMMFDNVAMMGPQIRSGALKAIAITSRNRVEGLPDVPTFEQAGMPNFEVIGWFALWAPSRTDPSVLRSYNQAANRMLAQPAVKARLAELGSEPLGGSPEDLMAFFVNEQKKWGDIIRATGIRM